MAQKREIYRTSQEVGLACNRCSINSANCWLLSLYTDAQLDQEGFLGAAEQEQVLGKGEGEMSGGGPAGGKAWLALAAMLFLEAPAATSFSSPHQAFISSGGG